MAQDPRADDLDSPSPVSAGVSESQAAVARGQAESVSAWVSEAMRAKVEHDRRLSALDAFLARTEILVCLMPLTTATRGILGRTTFDRLPRGAGVINAGRGGHLVEADLLEALASGRIADAVLDVFETEPLPHDHPFWHHPQIVVTPHVAARTNPTTAAQAMAANLRRLASGEAFPDRVDPETGY